MNACSRSLRSWARTLQRQRPLVSCSLTTPVSRYLLRRISISWFRLQTRLSKMTANLPFLLRIPITDMSGPSCTSCTLVVYSITERASDFCGVLYNKIQPTENISYFSVSPSMITIRPFRSDTENKAKKWSEKAAMQQKLFVAKVEQNVVSLSSKQDVLSENALSDTLRKRSVRNKNDKSSSQEDWVFRFGDLEVFASSKMEAWMTGQSTKNVLTEPFAFDGSVWGKLQPGHTAPLMFLYNLSRPWVLNCQVSAMLSSVGIWRPEHVASFLHAFHKQHAHRANVLTTKSSTLLLGDTIWLYNTVAVAKENNLGTGWPLCGKRGWLLSMNRRADSFCSTPYRDPQPRLRYSRKHCGPMQAPRMVHHALEHPGFFDSMTKKNLKDFMLSNFFWGGGFEKRGWPTK